MWFPHIIEVKRGGPRNSSAGDRLYLVLALSIRKARSYLVNHESEGALCDLKDREECGEELFSVGLLQNVSYTKVVM